MFTIINFRNINSRKECNACPLLMGLRENTNVQKIIIDSSIVCYKSRYYEGILLKRSKDSFPVRVEAPLLSRLKKLGTDRIGL